MKMLNEKKENSSAGHGQLLCSEVVGYPAFGPCTPRRPRRPGSPSVQGVAWSSDKEIEAEKRIISSLRHMKVLNLQGSSSNQFDKAFVNQVTAPDRWRTKPSDCATLTETIIRQCSFVDWGAGEVAAVMFPLASHSVNAQHEVRRKRAI
jgi:hypothetical protein